MDTSSISVFKRCTKCGVEYPSTAEYFNRTKNTKSGLVSNCRKCSRQQKTEYNRSRGHKPRTFSVVENGMRRCTKCGEWKPNSLEHFNRDSQKADGVSPYCKDCDYQNTQRWRQENPEKQLAKSRRESAAMTPLRREQRREYYRKYARRAVESGRTKVVFNRRRARKHSLPDTLTHAEWQNALAYFGNCCAVCGRPRGLWHTIAADHWIPLASPNCPGTVKENMIPLCHGIDGCNNSKNDIDPSEWLILKFGKRRAKQILARIQAYFDSLK
jgi:hypothetical protein